MGRNCITVFTGISKTDRKLNTTLVKLFRQLFSTTTFWLYISLAVILILVPLGTEPLNNINILQLRGDYFLHILLFMPWAFFHNAAAKSLRLRICYWPLALSFWSAAKPTAKSQKPTAKSQQPSWLLLGLFFAAGTEGLQHFLPWRAFNVNDLLANGLGILVGFALVLRFNIRRSG